MAIDVEIENNEEKTKVSKKKAMKGFEKVVKNIKKEKEFCCILVSPKDSVIISHATAPVMMNFIKACANGISASVESIASSASDVIDGFDDELKSEIDKMVKREMKKQKKR